MSIFRKEKEIWVDLVGDDRVKPENEMRLDNEVNMAMKIMSHVL
jgi:hypothetical protein